MAAGTNVRGHYFGIFGASVVCALPVAAGTNVSANYFGIFGLSEVRAPAVST